jgi:hypothetical protein
VIIDSEVSASAREIGVLEDLTITSATSANGIALRRVRGGVVRDDEDEPGAENSLIIRFGPVAMSELTSRHLPRHSRACSVYFSA